MSSFGCLQAAHLKDVLLGSGEQGVQALREAGINRLSVDQSVGILRQRVDMY